MLWGLCISTVMCSHISLSQNERGVRQLGCALDSSVGLLADQVKQFVSMVPIIANALKVDVDTINQNIDQTNDELGGLEDTIAQIPTPEQVQDLIEKAHQKLALFAKPIATLPYTISTPGYYGITQVATASDQVLININASDVVLDLCGLSLICNSDGTAIKIAPGLKNIIIKNGFISTLGGIGIDAQSTADAPLTGLLLQNLRIDNCNYGVLGNYVQNSHAIGCVLGNNDQGICLSNTLKSVVDNCIFNSNYVVACLLNDCQYNNFRNCTISGPISETLCSSGIVSKGGMGNSVDHCLITGIPGSTTGCSDISAGVGFLGEAASNIFNSCITNTTSLSSNVYGIYAPCRLLDYVVNPNDYSPYYSFYSFAWSPNGLYLAAPTYTTSFQSGTSQVDSTFVVYTVSNDRFVNALYPADPLLANGHSLSPVAWSPDSSYIMATANVSVGSASKNNIFIYSFDGIQLSLQATFTESSNESFHGACWSSDNTYLCIYGWDYSKSGGFCKILSFKPGTAEPIKQVAGIFESNIGYNSASWLRGTSYLAIGGSSTVYGEVRVYSFSNDKLKYVTRWRSSTDPYGFVTSIAISPDDQYIAAAYKVNKDNKNSSFAGDVEILCFDQNNNSLTELTKNVTSYFNVFNINSISWSSRPPYICVGQSYGTTSSLKAEIVNFMTKPSCSLLKPFRPYTPSAMGSTQFNDVTCVQFRPHSLDYAAIERSSNGYISRIALYTQVLNCNIQSNLVTGCSVGIDGNNQTSNETVFTNLIMSNQAAHNAQNYGTDVLYTQENWASLRELDNLSVN